MSTSPNHRDLFRQPGTVDKLDFFQSLLDSKDLIVDLALALVIIIRSELEQPKQQSASAYRRYAEVIRSLCAQMPELYEQVVHAWRQRRPVALPRPAPKEEPELPEPGEKTPPQVDAE